MIFSFSRPRWFHDLSTRPILVVMLLWIVSSPLTLTKPITVDDTAYLDVAKVIIQHPASIMQSKIFLAGLWQNVAFVNQPHGFMWLLALVISLVGESAITLHIITAFFHLAAVLACVEFARRSVPQMMIPVGLMAIFGPAFYPGINLMTDIPLLALSLWSILLLTPTQGQATWRQAVLAGIFAASAILLKYTALVLLPVFVWEYIRTKERKIFISIAIAGAALLAWSIWTYSQYGHVHWLDRPADRRTLWPILLRLDDWLTALGAIVPFVWWWRPSFLSNEQRRYHVLGAIALGFVVSVIHAMVAEATLTNIILRAIFFSGGVYAIFLTIQSWRHQDISTRKALNAFGLWSVGVALFTIVLSPFMAVRHVMLSVPFILIVFFLTTRLSRRSLIAATGLTVLLGSWLTLSDWVWAKSFQTTAQQISKDYPTTKVWYLGHWGWQWYAEREGFRPLEIQMTEARVDELVAIPEIPLAIKWDAIQKKGFERKKQYTSQGSAVTFLRAMQPSPKNGYYGNSWRGLPWTLTTDPLVTTFIFTRTK